MARKIAWTVVVIAFCLSIAWLLVSRRDGPRPTDAAPAAEAERPAGVAKLPASQTTASTAQTPRARPKQGDLDDPLPFRIDADGEKIDGLIWPSPRDRVPLLVLVPGPADRARHWQPLVTALAASRPLHIAAFDARRLAQGGNEPFDERARKLARIDRVIEHVRSRVSQPTVLGLVGNDSGATAALLVSARRRDVRATVALSPLLRIGNRSLVEVLDILARRQVFAATTETDGRTAGAMRNLATLEHARLSRRPIRGHGLEMLITDPGLVSDICGWLYATLGPVDR